MSVYLAVYDITADRRRRRVADALASYGHRIQKSVFEVWLDPHEVGEVRARIGMLLEPTDEFELVPVDDRGTRPRSRWQREIEPWDAVVYR